MSPLEAARRLSEIRIGHCHGCGAMVWAGGEHADNCPMLLLPQIVAALEAAERVADRFDYADKTEMNALMGALVAALKEPEA